MAVPNHQISPQSPGGKRGPEVKIETPFAFEPGQYATRGAAEFSVGRFQDAALSYSAVATSRPENPDALYNLALCFERCERWDAAAEAFEHVLRLDYARAEARLALAGCLLHMRRVEEALTHFDRAAVGPHREAALFGKAVTLQLLRRFEEAAEIYGGLLSSSAHAEEALSNWIALAIETEDLEEVRQRAQRLFDRCPQSAAALRGLATVSFRDGDHNAAAFYCEKLLDLAPESLEAWHNLRIALGRIEFGLAQPAFTLYSGGKR